MKKIYLFAATGLTIAFYSFLSKTNSIQKYHVDGFELVQSSANPPAGRTGAPGESNCTSCHSGSTMSAEGLAFLNFEGDPNYIPGQTYNATIATPEGPKNGFELTILNEDDEKAGEFIAGENTSVTAFGGREYVRHSASLGMETWSFQWVAPEIDMGTVTAYFAINKANNNGASSGDEIFLGSKDISADAEASIFERDKPSPLSAYINEEANIVHVNYVLSSADKIVLNIQDMTGRLILQKDYGKELEGSYNKEVSLSQDLVNGTYIIALFVGNRVYNKKVVYRK